MSAPSEFEVEKFLWMDGDTGEKRIRFAVVDRTGEKVARFDVEAEADAEATRLNGLCCAHELPAIRHRTMGNPGAFCARCGATVGTTRRR